jgi:hypothetical protein
MSRVSVVVASHKPYDMPSDNATYLPVEVGSALRTDHIEGFQRDDQGDNISSKNKSYCELTALYWAWKNSDAEVLGLAHYRRHFCTGRWSGINSVLSGAEIDEFLRTNDLIVPKKRHYVIETMESHYAHTHEPKPLDVCERVVADASPEYMEALREILGRRSAHMFNMFVGRREVVDNYCSWLFGILAGIESNVDISGYSEKEKRVFGYVSELLLDVWIEVNQPKLAEIPVHHLEGEKWLVKGPRFIVNKVRGTVSGISSNP